MTKAAALTITKATADARRKADKIMPNRMITVESRGSWDMATDTDLMITTITHPDQPVEAMLLAGALRALPQVIKVEKFPTRTVVTRKK